MVFEYHRHPRAGEVLTATVADGEEWFKQGRRGGASCGSGRLSPPLSMPTASLCVTARWINVRADNEVRE